jgi:hypothetical protein
MSNQWSDWHKGFNDELFDAPFNLAGELIDNGVTAEGEARVRALAEAEARKAQGALFGLSVGDNIRWTESDSRGLKSYQSSVIVKVHPARYSGAHTFYSVAGRDYLVRDDLVRNSF